MAKKDDSRIPSGIPGFDALIEGGFVKGSVNLVTGGTGTGKTIFALQFTYNQIQKGRNVLYVSFEENLEGLVGDGLLFGWDFEKLQKEQKVFFSTFRPVGSPDVATEFTKLVKTYGISIVIIDSISVMALAFEENYYKMRKELYLLIDLLKRLGCTCLFTAEIPGEASLDVTTGGALSRDGVSEFVADSVITLHNAGIGGEGDRAIRVLKMRRTSHVKDPVQMDITDKGMVVKKQ
ncbi:MAG: ATPase domain-containing protein [Nanoarchaeota archaeon]|mgnify:CR=1 FL=1